MKLKTEYITEHNRFWSEINNLAKEAFPPEEYLAPIELVRMSKANNFDFLLLTDDEQFVGFMVVQTHKNLAYLFFLAIDSSRRSKGYGSYAIEALKEVYNLTAFSMCAHNGTHIDAPFHFIRDGKTVDEICLEAFVGMAYVAEHNGIVTGNDATEIIEKAKKQSSDASKRVLIKGNVEVSLEAARVFASSDIMLLGNELQTIGPQDAPMAVHLTLLGSDVVLLEGIRLLEVSEGIY